MIEPNLPNRMKNNPIHLIPGAMESLLRLKDEEGTFGIWVPYDPVFDMSIVVTLLIAVITVALGSLWSGYVKHHLRIKLQEQYSLPTTARRARADSSEDDEEREAPVAEDDCPEGQRSRRDSASPGPPAALPVTDDEEQICEDHHNDRVHVHPSEDISLRISPTYVLFYVILMCGMLVLLYFFMDYLGELS